MLSVAILFSQGRKGDVISQLCFLFLLKFILLCSRPHLYKVIATLFWNLALNLFFFFFRWESQFYPYRFSYAFSRGFGFSPLKFLSRLLLKKLNLFALNVASFQSRLKWFFYVDTYNLYTVCMAGIIQKKEKKWYKWHSIY